MAGKVVVSAKYLALGRFFLPKCNKYLSSFASYNCQKIFVRIVKCICPKLSLESGKQQVSRSSCSFYPTPPPDNRLESIFKPILFASVFQRDSIACKYLIVFQTEPAFLSASLFSSPFRGASGARVMACAGGGACLASHAHSPLICLLARQGACSKASGKLDQGCPSGDHHF